MRAKEFALYKGEELLAMGIKREIAEQLGVSASTVGTIEHQYMPVELVRKEGD